MEGDNVFIQSLGHHTSRVQHVELVEPARARAGPWIFPVLVFGEFLVVIFQKRGGGGGEGRRTHFLHVIVVWLLTTHVVLGRT